MGFKTGPSYGFRDALAAGVVGDYVILVWTGRADGGARADMTGRDAALPLLFDVADQIAPTTSAPRPLSPRAAPAALQQLDLSGGAPRPMFPPGCATLGAARFGPASRGMGL